ncbi:transposable element Tcb2 transposase [Trichonephila clavipes]|nr:transposable element Tcb2 transposase [Trichonephila clavipes]
MVYSIGLTGLTSRFYTVRDFAIRIFIWREPGIRYLACNVPEIDHYGSGALVVRACITLDGVTHFHVFTRDTATAVSNRDKVLETYIYLLMGAVAPDFILEEFLECDDIRRMNWSFRTPELIHIEQGRAKFSISPTNGVYGNLILWGERGVTGAYR